MLREKAGWELHKDTAYCFEQNLEEAPHKTAISQSIQDEQDRQDTAG